MHGASNPVIKCNQHSFSFMTVPNSASRVHRIGRNCRRVPTASGYFLYKFARLFQIQLIFIFISLVHGILWELKWILRFTLSEFQEGAMPCTRMCITGQFIHRKLLFMRFGKYWLNCTRWIWQTSPFALNCI